MSAKRDRHQRVLGILIAGLMLNGVAFCQQLDHSDRVAQPAKPAPVPAKKAIPISPVSSAGTNEPFKITVTKTLFLPPEMYGHWSVTGTLVETNAPWYFNPVVHDIWELDRTPDAVTIANPATGATASINVDKVENNTATFHRQVAAGRNRWFYESPTITVNGDTMHGETRNRFEQMDGDKVGKTFFATYRLQAERISPSRVRLQQDKAPPEFEIEPMRVES